MSKLKFVCPKCGGGRVECIQDGYHSCEALVIEEDGDFDWGEILSEADQVVCFQCVTCGHIITDGDNDNITDNIELVEWIKEHQVEGLK